MLRFKPLAPACVMTAEHEADLPAAVVPDKDTVMFLLVAESLMS